MTQTLVAGTIRSLPRHAPIDVPRAAMVLGAASVGAFVGFQLGGPHGAAAGAMVASVVASIAVLAIRRMRLTVHPGGKIMVEIEWAV